MKKSLIAVAVAGAVGAPMSAAQAAEAYGFINVGLDVVSKDAGGAAFRFGPGVPDIIFAGGGDGSMHLSDTAESRFGFKGSEDLGNGLTAGYRFEFGLGTESFATFPTSRPTQGGSVFEDTTPTTRLANVSLSGDFGTVKVGTQWGTLYEYLGWNVYRADANGGAGWYYAAGPLLADPSGLRIDHAVTYTYGAGGYGSDPFTFSVQGVLKQDTPITSTDPANDETLDATVIGAQGTFGDFQVNGVAYQDANGVGAPEPSLTGIGVTWSAGDLYVGGNYMVTDLDVSGVDDLETLMVLATYNFGGGNSGMAGFSSGDSGNIDADLSAVFLQFQHQFSSRTKVYVEVESATVDNAGFGGEDGTTDLVSLNMKHSF